MTNKTPLALILIFATLVIAGSLFVFFQKQAAMNAPFNVGQKPPVQPVTTSKNQSELGSLDTSTWKTYRNEEYGFEIKYPPDFEVEKKNEDFGTFFSINNKNVKIGGSLLIGVQKPWPRGLEGEASIEYALKEEKLFFSTVTAIKHTVLANGRPYSISVSKFQGIKNPKWGKDAEIFFMDLNNDINEKIISTLRFLD